MPITSYRMVYVQVCFLLNSLSASKTTKNLENLGFELPSLLLEKLGLLILLPHVQKRNSFLDFPEQTISSPPPALPRFVGEAWPGSTFGLPGGGGEEKKSVGTAPPQLLLAGLVPPNILASRATLSSRWGGSGGVRQLDKGVFVARPPGPTQGH